MIKKFNYLIQSILIYIFFLLGRIVGLKASRKIFSKFFSLIGPLFKSKKVIYNNLKTFSSQISDQEKKEISNNMWENYGKTFIEYIFLERFRKKDSHIEIKGQINLTHLIKNKKPVIFVSGHFANFELMSMEIGKVNIDDNSALASQFEVRAIPTIKIFKNGSVVDTIVGLASKEDLKQRLA